jgi:hypothetical protein
MAYTNIDDSSVHFQIALYTGNGGTLSITNDGNSDLQPDWIWLKSRSVAASHNSYDSSRGTGKHLAPDITYQEITYYGVTAFNSDGFTISSGNDMNYNGATFAAWQWKANGGTTSTDTTSSITSTVQVNSDAGFSIVTYTGDGTTAGGFGHGLGVAPSVVFVKRRNTAADWCVYHKGMGADYFMKLNTTDAQASGVWQGIAPSSTRVTVYQGGLVNGNGDTYVAYCFAEKQGFSKFGSYKGNSSTDGTFVYLGFKPRWVMIKSTSSGVGWFMHDTKRSTTNVMDDYLRADVSSQEGISSTINIDFLSNGFKLRYNNNTNFSSHNYVYMAFAENPFVTSTGIPTTAR